MLPNIRLKQESSDITSKSMSEITSGNQNDSSSPLPHYKKKLPKKLKSNNQILYEYFPFKFNDHKISHFNKENIFHSQGKFEHPIKKFEYNDLNLIKSPSLNDNLSTIHNMINNRRIRKKNYFDKIFFNSLFYNEYLDDIPIKRKNILSYKRITKNNSSANLSAKRLYNLRNNNHSSINSSHNVSTNITNIYKKNNSINNDNRSTTNNSKILPEINSIQNKISLNSADTEISKKLRKNFSLPLLSAKPSQKQTNEHSIIFDNLNFPEEGTLITSLGVTKMKYKINEAMYENSNNKKTIGDLAKKILKLKILQGYQRDKLEEVLYAPEFNIQEKIDQIFKCHNLFVEIFEEYKSNLSKYIFFLWKKTTQLEDELDKMARYKKDLYYEVETLVVKSIVKQGELEKLIGFRNFLFEVQRKDFITRQAPPQKKLGFRELLHDESKKKDLFLCLLKLFGKNKRSGGSVANRYLKLITSNSEINVKKYKSTRYSIYLQKKEDIKKKLAIYGLPKPGEKIFESPEKFIESIDELQNKLITKIKNDETKRRYNMELKEELDSLKNVIYEPDYIERNKEIAMRKEELKELKIKNNILQKKLKYLDDINQKNNMNIAQTKTSKEVVSYNSFLDMKYFQIISYNNLLKKYKFTGNLLLNKLINYLLYLYKNELNYFNLDPKEYQQYLAPEEFINIIKASKEGFNEKNYFLISEYTLKILRLYEFVGNYIIARNNKNKENEGYKNLYQKINDKIQASRKTNNAKNIRKLIDKKREKTGKKLIEKWEKQVFIQNRIFAIDIRPELHRNRSQDNIRISQTNKNKKSDILNIVGLFA